MTTARNTSRLVRLTRAALLCLGAASFALTACKKSEQVTVAPVQPQPQPEPEPSPEPVAAKEYPAPPEPSAPKPFDFPEVETFTLSNGMTVYVVQNSEVPLVSSQLVLRTGEMDAEHVASFASMMLAEGTKSRTKAKIDEAIEFVGGTLSQGSGVHVSYVSARTMKDDVKLALILMGDQVMNPVFPEESLGKLKEQTKTAISLAKSQPQSLATTLFDMVAYPEGHPYGRPLPTEADVDAIKVEDVREFHDTFYKSNNAFLILSGDITAQEAKPLAERALGKWKSTRKQELPPNPLNAFKSYDLPKQLVVHLVDRPTSAQTEVIVGNLALARNHPDWVELEVANTILGDDASGRLFKDIREDRGLTYGIYSKVSAGQAPGTFSIQTRTRTKTTGEMLAAIFEHIKQIRGEAPTQEEVDRVVQKLLGNFPLGLETPSEIAGKVREALIYNLPPTYWETYREELLSVTPESVHEAARKYIHPVPHVVLVGKASKILPQLQEVLPDAEVIVYDEELQPKSGAQAKGKK